MSFSEDFTWGCATAAYQIEGAAREDGKGLSVWDRFCQKAGTVWNGQTGDIACDHYHRYQDDVALMKQIGLKAYRFSISWPRVLPDGTGTVNAKGLDFYDRLVDELTEADIEPFITLFHWDYPQALFLRGGWLNRDSADWFADYTHVVVEKLSDRVHHWITLNEPQCFIGFGHWQGKHAPGLKLNVEDGLLAGHNALRAHGKAVRVIRQCDEYSNIGYAPVGVVCVPKTDNPADIAAAQIKMFEISESTFWTNSWWMDPIFLGRYPEDGLKVFAERMPKIESNDLEEIAQPIDFLGLNVYRGITVEAGSNGNGQVLSEPVGYPITAFDWPITPLCLYWGPTFFQQRYGKPIYITENGMSNRDIVSLDGKVHDPQRIDYLHRHLSELGRAIDDGVNVKGYFQWSLMDNFEWAEGYKERFGLIYIDYPAQRRILKDSAKWYSEVIATQGKTLNNA